DLEALVADLAAVEDLRAVARGRRGHALEQEVRGIADEARQLPGEAAVHREAVDPGFDLLHPLRRDDGRAGRRRHRQAFLTAELRRRQVGVLVAEQRQVARLAVRGAQLDLAPGAGDARDAVRARELGEDVVPARIAVHAAPLRTQPAQDEQPV